MGEGEPSKPEEPTRKSKSGRHIHLIKKPASPFQDVEELHRMLKAEVKEKDGLQKKQNNLIVESERLNYEAQEKREKIVLQRKKIEALKKAIRLLEQI